MTVGKLSEFTAQAAAVDSDGILSGWLSVYKAGSGVWGDGHVFI